MPPIVKDLFLSKKFLVALLTAAGSATVYLGLNVDLMAVLTLATPFLIYIGAQGWGADAGKEKAKIEQETALKLQAAAQEHDKVMVAMNPMNTASVKTTAEAGSARLGVVLAVSVLGLALALSCAHPGQVALRTGQCVLDSGVLSTVYADLAQSNYSQLINDLATKVAPEAVDCALQAVASQPAPGPGSGSATAARSTAAPADTLAQRAREVLAARRSASKN